MDRFNLFVARFAFGLMLPMVVGVASSERANGVEIICSISTAEFSELPARRFPDGPRILTSREVRPLDIPPTPQCIEIFGGPAVISAPSSGFVGLRDTATGTRRDIIFADDTDTGTQFGGTVTFGPFTNVLSPNRPASITLGGSFARFTQSTFVPFFDPGDNRLLIFGTGVDPSGPGFDIGPGGGTFNDTEDYRYSRSINQFEVWGQYNMPIGSPGPGGIQYAALLRFGFKRTNIDEEQSASVPNVPLAFHNTIDLGVNTFTPGVGLQFLAPITSNVAVHGYAWGGAAISHGTADETFAFSGLFNGVQHNEVSFTHVGFAGEIGGGVTVLVNGGAVSVTGSFSRSNSHPIAKRTGETGKRSEYFVEDQDNIGTRIRFMREIDPSK